MQEPPASARRSRAIKLAYGTSLLSKVATAVVQLLALPFAARALGVEGFGAVVTLAAVTSILYIPALGLSPATSLIMSQALGEDRPDQARAVLRDSCHVGFASASVLMLLGIALISYVPIHWIYGDGQAITDTVARTGIAAMWCHVCLAYAVTFVDGARASYLQNHVTNLFSFMASIGVIAATAISVFTGAGIGGFYVAIFVVPVLFQAINLVLLLASRRPELHAAAMIKSDYGRLLSATFSYVKAQAGMVMHQHGYVYLATQSMGLAYGAAIGGFLRLFMQVNSLYQSLLNPLVPTLSQASTAGDSKWLIKSLGAVSIAVGVTLPMMALVLALFGSDVIRIWLDIPMPTTRWLVPLLAIWGTVGSLALIMFTILMALGRSTLVAYTLLTTGLVSLISNYYFLDQNMMVAGLTANILLMLVSGFLVPAVVVMLVLRQLRAAG
jgi:O-antigen/teichoic acid export membrane protein